MTRKLITSLLAVGLCLALTGCGMMEKIFPVKKAEIEVQNKEKYEIVKTEKYKIAAIELTADVNTKKTYERQPDEAFKKAYQEFAVNMFKETVSREQNSLISPYSMIMALAMTANGANADTLSEMENVLGGGMSIDSLNEYLYCLQKTSNKDSGFKSAQSLWIKKNSVKVNDSFLENVKSCYDSQVYEAAFDSNTVSDINNWVNRSTDGMIKELIKEIGTDSFMYIINALCFEKKWDAPYMDYQVKKDKFTSIDGKSQDVNMMNSTEYHYIEGDGVKGFKKPYEADENGKRYNFVALLPDDFDEFVDNLTADKLTELLTNNIHTTVYAGLPKFSYDYSLSVKQSLINMGMENAFLPSADFSKMSDEKEIFIGDVIHKTYIDVSESGTKAAAVTAVEMDCGSSMPEEPKEVYLNKPFIYMIVDSQTNIPIFMGAVVEIK